MAPFSLEEYDGRLEYIGARGEGEGTDNGH